MIENIDTICEYVAGYSEEAFERDRKTVDAVERCLQRLTEAAIKIGDEQMTQMAPAVPMAKLRGLGNALRHSYDLIDDHAIWNIIIVELPKIAAECRQALGRETGL